MENQNLFGRLSDQLQEMERSGKVNLSVTKPIGELIEHCASFETLWINRTEVPTAKSFVFYHASRNARLILERMKKRFTEAEKKHDNPTVAEQSLAIIPILGDLCNALTVTKEQIPTNDISQAVSQKTKILRDIAFSYGLLPTPEEEKDIDPKRLKKRFGQFTDTLQAMFIEE